jgi:hypothetical protein
MCAGQQLSGAYHDTGLCKLLLLHAHVMQRLQRRAHLPARHRCYICSERSAAAAELTLACSQEAVGAAEQCCLLLQLTTMDVFDSISDLCDDIVLC